MFESNWLLDAAKTFGSMTIGGSTALTTREMKPTYAFSGAFSRDKNGRPSESPSLDALKSTLPLPSPMATTMRACAMPGSPGTRHTKLPPMARLRQVVHGTLPPAAPASTQQLPVYFRRQFIREAGVGTASPDAT